MSAQINTANSTVEGTRKLRSSGSSTVVTIPPEILQTMNLSEGDKMQITGNWETGQITIERVE